MSNRNDTIHVRLARNEREQLEAAAKGQHLPLSTWLRSLALREAERQSEPEYPDGLLAQRIAEAS